MIMMLIYISIECFVDMNEATNSLYEWSYLKLELIFIGYC